MKKFIIVCNLVVLLAATAWLIPVGDDVSAKYDRFKKIGTQTIKNGSYMIILEDKETGCQYVNMSGTYVDELVLLSNTCNNSIKEELNEK
jgi:hypothetical protein